MKYADEFRRIARETLQGKWTLAVIAGVITSLLGGLGSEGPELKLNIDSSHANVSLQYAGQTILSTSEGLNSGWGALLAGVAMYIAIAAIVLAVVFFVIGSVVAVGYAQFNLEQVDGGTPSLDRLFAHFRNWKTTAVAKFLRTLYVLLWSLLFIIPGIIAGYSYAMTDYILAEHPEMTASEAIETSKQMMSGNRFRLFCLQFSFIGWSILCIFTLGIGNLWLTPYKQAATAAFYREVSHTERIEY